MKHDDVHVDFRLLRVILSIHVLRGNREKVFETFKAIQSSPNLSPSVLKETYIQMHCLAKEADKAFEVLDSMRNEGIFVFLILRNCIDFGPGIGISFLTYTSIMDLAIKEKDEALMFRLFESMKIDGISPNHHLFCSLLQLYFEKDDLEGVARNSKKLVEKGLLKELTILLIICNMIKSQGLFSPKASQNT